MNSLLKINKSIYFCTLCAIMGLIAFASRQFLFTEQLYYTQLSEQLTVEQIQYVIASQSVWWKQMIGYAIIPLIVIIRVLYAAFCLYLGNLVA